MLPHGRLGSPRFQTKMGQADFLSSKQLKGKSLKALKNKRKKPQKAHCAFFFPIKHKWAVQQRAGCYSCSLPALPGLTRYFLNLGPTTLGTDFPKAWGDSGIRAQL